MWIVNQKRAGVILSYITIAANMIIQFAYTPIMLRLLGQSEYGLYTLANSVISYLSLFDMGFAGSYLRFYSGYRIKNDEEGIKKLNGTFLSLFLILSFLALACGLLLSSQIETIFHRNLNSLELKRAKAIMIILSFSLAISLMTNVFSSIMTAHECFFRLRLIRLFSTVFSPMIGIPLMLAGYGSISIAIVSLATSVWCFIDYGKYCIKNLEISIDFKFTSKSLIFDVGRFSFFIFLNEIVSQINWSVDKVLLGIYYGTVMTAIYGVGSQIDVVYRTLSSSVSAVFAPQVNTLVAEGDNEKKLTLLFCRIGRIQWILLAPILMGFIGFGRFFVELWAGTEYSSSYYVALLLIVPVSIPLIQNIGIEIQRAMNKHQFRSIIYSIMAIVNICISIPLCKLYGAIGCAIGTSISVLVGNGIIMNWFYMTKLRIDIKKFWKEILSVSKGMIPAVIFVSALVIIPIKWNIVNFALLAIAFIAIYIIFIWKLGINEYEKSLFSHYSKKIMHR